MQWREDEAHALVTQLHDEALALTAAHEDLGQHLADKGPAALPLDAAVVKMLGTAGGFDRQALVNVYRPKGESRFHPTHPGCTPPKLRSQDQQALSREC